LAQGAPPENCKLNTSSRQLNDGLAFVNNFREIILHNGHSGVF